MAGQSIFQNLAREDTLFANRALVSLPFVGWATSSAVVSAAPAYVNSDGSRTCIEHSAAAGWTNGGTISHWFNGSVFGLRYARTNAPIDVVIDGVVYPVPVDIRERPDTLGTSPLEYDTLFLVATDLDRSRKHMVDIILTPSLVATRYWQITGYVVEATGNPMPPQRGVDMTRAPTPLTVADTWYTLTPTNNIQTGWTGFYFRNGNASPATVSISYSDTNGVLETVEVPAGKAVPWRPAAPIHSAIRFKSSVTDVVVHQEGLNG